MLLAVAGWRSEPRRRDVPNARVALPIAFTVTAFALVSYEAFADLDVLAVVLIRLTLLAVVLRLGVTLCGCPVSVPISRRWRPRIR
jgi:hypothetical protein